MNSAGLLHTNFFEHISTFCSIACLALKLFDCNHAVNTKQWAHCFDDSIKDCITSENLILLDYIHILMGPLGTEPKWEMIRWANWIPLLFDTFWRNVDMLWQKYIRRGVVLKSFLFQSIGISIQKGNAACILGTKGIYGKLEELSYL